MSIEEEGTVTPEEEQKQTGDGQESGTQPEEDGTVEDGGDAQAESEAETKGDEEDDKAGEAKSEPQKPLSKEASRRQRDRERIEAAEAEASRLEERRYRIVKAGESDLPPNKDDFEERDEYLAAKAVYDASKRQRDRELQEVEADAKAAGDRLANERRQAFDASAVEARTRYKDFDEVLNNTSAPLTSDMIDAIQDSELGADIAYFLAKNPTKAREIATVNRERVFREIGKLETRLVPAAKPNKPAVPEPLKPVTGKSQAKPRTYHQAKSYEEHKAIAREQEKQARG